LRLVSNISANECGLAATLFNETDRFKSACLVDIRHCDNGSAVGESNSDRSTATRSATAGNDYDLPQNAQCRSPLI
jgi:hypothetical protein